MGVHDRAIVVETRHGRKYPARLLNPRGILLCRLQPGGGHSFHGGELLMGSLVGYGGLHPAKTGDQASHDEDKTFQRA